MLLHAFEHQSQAASLEISKTFPNLKLKDSNNRTLGMNEILTETTIVFIQPGASHTDQWKGREANLEEWKKIPGAAGCTAQVVDYQKQLKALQDKGFKVIGLLVHKTAEQLADVKKSKDLSYEIYSLTDNAIRKLKESGHPFFTFEDKQYPHRFTFILDANRQITNKFDRRTIAPAQEAQELLKSLNQVAGLETEKVEELQVCRP